MFVIKGKIEEEIYELKYDVIDEVATVTGDEVALFIFDIKMKSEDSVGPVGQYMSRDINNPLATLFVMLECFDEVVGHEGELPKADVMPADVIC